MRVLTSAGTWETVHVGATLEDFLQKGLSGLSPSIELVPGPDGLRRDRDYTEVYKTNPWLFATIRLRGKGLARMPAKVYRLDDSGSHIRIRAGRESRAEQLAAVLRRPGRDAYGKSVSGAALRKATMIDRDVHGNALWVVHRDVRGDYVGLERVPWRAVTRDKIAGQVRYYDQRPDSRRSWLADDVVHFGYADDVDSCVSPPPIGALHSTVTLYDAVERHLVAFFRNQARPSAHVEVDRGTGKTARDLIAKSIRELYTSPENAGKVLVTSGKWTSMTTNPDNSRVIELAKQAREEIVAAFNVPPPLVGILDRAIMANVRELRSHYARDVIGPDAGLFEGDIDAQLIAGDDDLDGVFMEFELDAVMRPDLEARAKTYKERRYVETLNEIRGTENLPRIEHPDADIPWMPLNEAPLDTPRDDDEGDDLFDRQEDDDA